MASLIICRICLSTESKVHNYDKYQLKSYYEEILGVKVSEDDGLPKYFCFQCAYMLQKFHKFKDKCYVGQKVLGEMLWRGSLSYMSVSTIDRQFLQLSSPLQAFVYNDVEITDNIKNINNIVHKFEHTTVHLENVDIIENRQVGTTYKTEIITDEELDFCEQTDTDVQYDTNNEQAIKTKNEQTKLKTKKEQTKKKTKNKKANDSLKKSIIYDNVNWKIINLTEDEARKEFQLRSEDPKYKAAAFKCEDCFKMFSRQDILKRHLEFRHRVSVGSRVCHFCKSRTKFAFSLRKHLRDHYTKYQCVRCGLVLTTENSALCHEESHSGVKRKCMYCSQEFRHSSTYYTHLRTHRSDHICTACGESFVSEFGLKMHKRTKHWAKTDRPDDDAENTFCSRCDKNFDTRKAYEEHLFHSAVHADELIIFTETEDTASTKPKKILGKKLQETITNKLNNCDEENVQIDPNMKKNKWRRGAMARLLRKPTTCHQCGKTFATQAECMKHHLKAHPRTSFFAPSQRHICEICGASLAPGSVANHQNMHTKETVYACETCGRQFYSSISLKRHGLTHTGEKPFECTECEKRFTQSNSLKLHYNTAHLKLPYPKSHGANIITHRVDAAHHYCSNKVETAVYSSLNNNTKVKKRSRQTQSNL